MTLTKIDFPALKPSGVRFTYPKFQVAVASFKDVITYRRKWSDVPVDPMLDLDYTNDYDSVAVALLDCRRAAFGSMRGLNLNLDLLAGVTDSDTQNAILEFSQIGEWVFAAQIDGESIIRSVTSVQVKLRGRLNLESELPA